MHCLARFEGGKGDGAGAKFALGSHHQLLPHRGGQMDKQEWEGIAPWNRQLLLLIDPQRVQMRCCSSDLFDKLQCSEYADLSLIFDKL